MGKRNNEIKDIFIAGLDAIPEAILNTEAVKQGLFTGAEMMGAIDCFKSDFNSIFFAIDNFKGIALVIELEKWEREFNNRFLNCPDRQLYEHHNEKLNSFIKDKIREAQSSIYSKTKSELKPLRLKDMAVILDCSPRTLTRRINNFIEERKFNKTGIGREYSIDDLICLEQLLGCSFLKK